MDKDKVYISYDADNAGNRISRAVLADDPDEMSRISERIKLGNKLFDRWAHERGARQLSSGGDQGVYSISRQYVHELEQLRKDYHFITQLTVSIGIGEHLSESGQALLVAKLLGKDRIVFFDKDTKKKIQQIKKAAKKGRYHSMEEQKIAEANFKKSESDGDPCPYCEKSDGIDPSHCKFCHDAETQVGEETCPYCKGSQNDPALGVKEPEIAEEDCAFCNEKSQTEQDSCPYCNEAPGLGKPEITDGKAVDSSKAIPSLVSPDSNNAQAPAGSDEEQAQYDRMGMNPPEINKPTMDDHAPISTNAPMDVVPKGDPDPNQRLDDQRDVEVVGGNATGTDAVDAANDNFMAADQSDVQSESGNANAINNTMIDPEDTSSKDALTAIAEQIREEGTSGQPIANQRDRLGNENIPSGEAMEGNISRPQGFAQDVPSDTGEEGVNPLSDNSAIDGDDEPDFRALLEEGLDNHAKEAQKQKAVQMVSQALMEFKGCKDILEQNRAQMPQLYQASISMLKAMIELAGILNLGGGSGQPEQTQELGEVQAELEPEVEQNQWHDPFPTHPDHGGEEGNPEHAPPTDSSEAETNADGTGEGTIGQPIGKLPTKNTTVHTKRTVLPINGVNSKGQQKIMANDGSIRFINRKASGMVMGPSGVPVRPEKRN
jgi:hypothetical protein